MKFGDALTLLLPLIERTKTSRALLMMRLLLISGSVANRFARGGTSCLLWRMAIAKSSKTYGKTTHFVRPSKKRTCALTHSIATR